MKKLLVVDDEILLRKVIGDYFEDAGFEVLLADQGVNGLDLFRQEQPDAVILDLDMPKLNGFELLKIINQSSPETPVIVISGVGIVGDAVRSLRLGAWDFLSKPIHDLEILNFTMERVLERAQLLKENRDYRERLEEKVRLRTQQLSAVNESLESTQQKIVRMMARAGEYRDNESGKHVIRVAKVAEAVAKTLGLPAEKTTLIGKTAALHDIGKIGIQDAILLKPGRLNQEELQVMMQHCRYGFDILTGGSTSNGTLTDLLEYVHELSANPQQTEQLLSHAGNIALFHHERWDGTGYPTGLKGDAIPIEARITALADVYDVLGCARPYRPANTEEDCQRIISELTGIHLDPDCVAAFFECIDEITAIKQQWIDD